MANERRQQRALKAFERVGIPGVHVLGVVLEDEFLVVIDAASITDQIRSRRIILSVDQMATRIHSARPPRRRAGLDSGPELAG